MSAFDAVEHEVRELVRRRALDPSHDRVAAPLFSDLLVRGCAPEAARAHARRRAKARATCVRVLDGGPR